MTIIPDTASKRSHWNAPLWRMALAAVFILTGTIIATHYHRQLGAQGLPWPRNTFLFRPEARYSDLSVTVDQAISEAPYTYSIPANYFPFIYPLTLRLARGLPPHVYIQNFLAICLALFAFAAVLGPRSNERLQGWPPQAALLTALFVGSYQLVIAWWELPTGLWGLEPAQGLTLLTTAAMGLAVVGAVVLRGAWRRDLVLVLLGLVVLLGNYPFIFGIDRGNIEAAMGGFCLLSLIFLVKGRPYLAAAILAPAIAAKGFPLALCVIFVARREALAAVAAALLAGLLTIWALLALPGGIVHNLDAMQHGLAAFNNGYAAGALRAFCADPLSGILIFNAQIPTASRVLDFVVGHYQRFALGILVLCSLYAWLSRASFHRKVLAVVLGMLLFPDSILDYKLVHLLTAIFFMIYADEPWDRRDFFLFIGLLVLMVPNNYYYVGGHSISTMASPVVLLLLVLGLLTDLGAWRSPALAPLRAVGPLQMQTSKALRRPEKAKGPATRKR